MMKYGFSILLYNRYRNILTQEIRKYAGHSKWQNIKANKQQKDSERAQLFKTITSKMRSVITETGNPDPDSNPKLASLIEHAKKVNMPLSTLNSSLEKIQNNKKTDNIHVMTISCFKGIVFVLHIATDNIGGVKAIIAHIVKKFNGKIADLSALNVFDCASYIIASKDCNLDRAMEDAIEADTLDVEEIKYDDSSCFQFKSEFLFPNKAVNQLKSLGYTIFSIENKCIPNSMVEIDEKELLSINSFKQKLFSEIKEIVKIEDNIISS